MPTFTGIAGGGSGVGNIPGVASPHKGVNAFGLVPGAIGVPQNVFSQLGQNVPNFGNLTGAASGVVGSELSGQISPQTMNALRNASAQFGVQSGMPGSGLQMNNLLGNIVGFTENRQRQGVQDYMGMSTSLGALQTDPRLAASIAERNAELAAAPDPEAAYRQQMMDWLTKFNMMKNFGGGVSPSGGSGNRGPQWASVSGMPNLGVPKPPAMSTGGPPQSQILYGPGGGPNVPEINANAYPPGTKFHFEGGVLTPDYPTGASPSGMLIYGGNRPTQFQFGGQTFGDQGFAPGDYRGGYDPVMAEIFGED